MANLNMDIIEEDAADLQFPKDWTSVSKDCKKLKMSVEKEEVLTLDSNCFVCKRIISEPYIHCAVCNSVILCATCFAAGKERLGHKNNHDYTIVQNDFPLIRGSGWTAKEVKSLLDLLQEYGFGNWEEMTNKLSRKSSKECERYYLQYFVKDQSLFDLSLLNHSASSVFGREPIAFTSTVGSIEDPPRFLPGTMNHKLMGGYNPARSDFEINFDNHAELKISKLNYNNFATTYEHYDLGQSLQTAVFHAYNTRLTERIRRQKIIRNHGLISLRKLTSCLLRYDCSMTRSTAKRIRIFTQVLKGTEFDSVMECLHQIGELKNYLQILFTYRQSGLKYFHNVSLFDELFKLQLKHERDRKLYLADTNFHWQKSISFASNKNTLSLSTIPKRRTAPPLDINPRMKEYDKLDQNERELCSLIRILPDMYMEIKHLLISESKKCGSVKLAQARQLLKIDVNKTKKIHEFLAKQNFIITN